MLTLWTFIIAVGAAWFGWEAFTNPEVGRVASNIGLMGLVYGLVYICLRDAVKAWINPKFDPYAHRRKR